MSNKFYTNVSVKGSKILYRGVENGEKVTRKINYSPTFYLQSKNKSNFTTIHGEYLKPIQPGTISDCRKFVEMYKDVDGFNIYGNQRYEYGFIADECSDDADWDISKIVVANIDIEVGSENGFPEPSEAKEEVTAITFKTRDKFIVLGCGVFNNTRDDVRYIKCRDEAALLEKFLDEWSNNYPDIITGWNIKFFDIPYLINRITKVLGEDAARRMSPWGDFYKRTLNTGMGKTEDAYVISGIAQFDYIELYKKFSPGGSSQESYRLDYIAFVEVGEKKLSYEEFGNLYTLYRENYQKFIEYNIRDTELVEKIDDKLKLIELALTLAYDARCNYDDVFAQVRMWDSIIFNHLLKSNIIMPPSEKHVKNEAYVGAFVKDPITGLHNWIASFDLNSLYPSLICQYNISPDTLIEPEQYDSRHTDILTEINKYAKPVPGNINAWPGVAGFLEKKINTEHLKAMHCTITPNGQFFTTTKQGFLPEIMEKMYADRVAYKEKAIQAKKELEKETDKTKRYEIEKRIARFNNLQQAKKVSLNSSYGALGNQFFRFFDVRQASAITTSGQLSIRWIGEKLNDYTNKLLKTDKDYIIASDTDSVYLAMGDLIEQTIRKSNPSASVQDVIKFMDKICESKIQLFITKSYEELADYTNSFEQKMIMKREALADRGIWVAKKRYILNVHNNEGVQYAKPKVKVMGLEVIKSSTPAICRTKLWEAISIILKGTEDDVMKFIKQFKIEFKESDIADIAFPRSINGVGKYTRDKEDDDTIKFIEDDSISDTFKKGSPIHVRGGHVYNKLLLEHKLEKKYHPIKNGEKIKFIYLKEPNLAHSHVISFPNSLPEEFGLNKYINYDLQYEKSFVDALKIILDAIGWKTEKTNSLEAFFG